MAICTFHHTHFHEIFDSDYLSNSPADPSSSFQNVDRNASNNIIFLSLRSGCKLHLGTSLSITWRVKGNISQLILFLDGKMTGKLRIDVRIRWQKICWPNYRLKYWRSLKGFVTFDISRPSNLLSWISSELLIGISTTILRKWSYTNALTWSGNTTRWLCNDTITSSWHAS